jgi:hypothetical protein
MAKVKVTFHECIQDSQEYGSDDEHMVSRVFFSIEISKVESGEKKIETYDNVYANLKQTVGGKFEETPIEVSPPYHSSGKLYSGPMNYEKFRKAAEGYFRKLVGSQGSGIRIEGGGSARMYNNRFRQEYSVEFEAADTRSAW